VFLRNFLRVVEGLQPKVACAYAASFVLVEPHNRWINDAKFEVPTPDEAWAKENPKSGTRVHLLLPNDIVDGVEITRGTTPRPTKERLAQAMTKELRTAAERSQRHPPMPLKAVEALASRLDERLRTHLSQWTEEAPFSLTFKLREAPQTPIRVELRDGTVLVRAGQTQPSDVTLELRAEILEATLRDDYGLESIFIGYGAVATMERPELFGRMQQLLVLLSPRRSSWRGILQTARENPMGTLGALWRQRMPVALNVGARLGLVTHLYEERHLGTAEPRKSATEAA
jgi:hypothetical protein